jgi:membrane protease YdiL (CAAX protease family)
MMTRRLTVSLAAFVGWLLITVVGGQMHTGEAPLLEAVTRGLGWPFLLASLFLLAMAGWQQWRDIGLNRLPSGRSLLLTWLPMLYIVVGLGLAVVFGLPPAGVLAWILFNTFLVGLSEELMFRGVLLQAFRRTVSIWPAVALTTLAFGAIHILNVFMTGDLCTALIQSAAAALSGLLFIALRLRTGSLWPCVVVHGLWDFATFTIAAARSGESMPGSGGGPITLMTFMPVLLVLPNALYGLWLMRRIGETHARPEC